mmetsp:Transcript_43434/g.138238  ORF Transcript_43434/g.138238 Transcript_43434/m.138238 type:complete len:321 (-) Transcript_43434:122-1084(-)
MPSASVRASSRSSCISARRASSRARSSATAISISRRFSAICSSSMACCRIMAVSFSLRSFICSSLSPAAFFQLSTVAWRPLTTSPCSLRRFSSSRFSLERLPARMWRPSGPSSRIWKRISKAASSPSNSSSLSSGGSVSVRLGTNWPFLRASLSCSCSFLLCRFSFPHSSERPRRSVVALFSCTCILVLSRMASSRCTTAFPTLSTRSATSFTRFRMDGSLPLAARPRCSMRTSWMCDLRISLIICMASCASFVSCPASRFASSSSRCSVSDCSRPFLNSVSRRWAWALKASFLAEVMASWSCSCRTLRLSLELSCRACW